MAAAIPASWESAGFKLGRIVRLKFTDDTHQELFAKMESFAAHEGVQHLSFKGEDFEPCVQNILIFIVELVDFFVRNRYKDVDANAPMTRARSGRLHHTLLEALQFQKDQISTAILIQFNGFLDEVLGSPDFFLQQIKIGPPKSNRQNPKNPKNPKKTKANKANNQKAKRLSRSILPVRLYNYSVNSFSENRKQGLLKSVVLAGSLVPRYVFRYRVSGSSSSRIAIFILDTMFGQSIGTDVSALSGFLDPMISFLSYAVPSAVFLYMFNEIRKGFKFEDEFDAKLYSLQNEENEDLTKTDRIELSLINLLASKEDSSRITKDLKKRIESYFAKKYTETGKDHLSEIINIVEKKRFYLWKFEIIEKDKKSELDKYYGETKTNLDNRLKNEKKMKRREIQEFKKLLDEYTTFKGVKLEIDTKIEEFEYLILHKLPGDEGENAKRALLLHYRAEKNKKTDIVKVLLKKLVKINFKPA